MRASRKALHHADRHGNTYNEAPAVHEAQAVVKARPRLPRWPRLPLWPAMATMVRIAIAGAGQRHLQTGKARKAME